MKPLTVRKKISYDESLYSFLLRCAEANGMSFFDLFNLLKKNKYRLHAGDVHRLDFCPSNVIDVNQLNQIFAISITDILNASFTNVIRIFKGSSSETNCMFLNNSIRDHLSYCPECFAVKKQIKLIWKIDDITTCLSHGRKLLDSCHHCSLEIKYKEITEMGRCPHCFCDLSKNIPNLEALEEKLLQKQRWFIRNWLSLLHDSQGIELSSNEIAMRLLFVLNDKHHILEKKVVRGKIKEASLIHFIQISRGTSKKRTIHIQTILSTIYSHDIEVEEFISMSLPLSFIYSLVSSRNEPVRLACIAPWCESFRSNKSIIKTSSKNKVKGKQFFKEYLICIDCGCEYAINTNREIVERTYFIKGYSILTNRRISKLTWPEKEKVMGLKRSRIRRILSYFYSRGIFLEDAPLVEIEQGILDVFCDAIRRGESIIEIQHWKRWKNDDQYLLYRYHSQVIRTLCEHYYEQTDMLDQKRDYEFHHFVQNTCKEMLIEDKQITLPSVSKMIGCSATTIQNKGCSFIVAKYKKLQQEQRVQVLKVRVMEQVTAYFENHLGYVYSVPLFESLEVCRSTLKKLAPEICKQIEEMRNERNSVLKDCA